MDSKEKYEEIRLSQIGQQNINVIKKFFCLKPKDVGQSSLLQYTDGNSFAIKMPTTQIKLPLGAAKFAIRKKSQISNNNNAQGMKYSIGFFEKSEHERQRQQQSPLQQTKITLQSKRVVQSEFTSFLLGINSRIQKQHKSKFALRFQDQSQTNDTSNGDAVLTKNDSSKLYKTTPAKSSSSKYKQIMDKVCSIKEKSYADSLIDKISDMGYKFQLNGPQSPLPRLSRRKQRSAIFTDKGSEKCINASTEFTSQKQFQTGTQKRRQNNQNQIKYINSQQTTQARSVSPRKGQKPQRIFEKGYLFYDPYGASFLKKYRQNLQNEPIFTKEISGISAKSFFVLNAENLTPIAGRKYKNEEPIQVASLTKIMTCYLCIIACKKYDVNMDEYTTRVSDRASQMPGTSAQLQAGDVLSLKDLLYGLMLPSGNDASVVLAQAIGRIIQKYKKKPTKKTPYQTFINHMNIMTRQLRIEQSYQNPSGLAFNPNKSTPQAICVLSTIATKNAIFNKVINTKQYELEIKNQRFGLSRKQIWRNTNKLLWKDWLGVKTGTTETAGHCLISRKNDFLIAVFDCQTLNKRFTECAKIYDFLVEQGVCKSQQKTQKSQKIDSKQESRLAEQFNQNCGTQQHLQEIKLLKAKSNDTHQQYKTL